MAHFRGRVEYHPSPLQEIKGEVVGQVGQITFDKLQDHLTLRLVLGGLQAEKPDKDEFVASLLDDDDKNVLPKLYQIIYLDSQLAQARTVLTYLS